ncbi:serine dehydratase beta chain, partial [Solicola sp. PLA-1-18]|uniref:serine dehydratase beta chain n=1 Tax=Solicola sp. PLA-1-18 TaxID=3380532 RepID=UPI003B814B7C
MAVSAFDLFKIGIGPSSSHTVGPMRAASLFVRALEADGDLDRTAGVHVELFGSLGATGHGHGSVKAVVLGLRGEMPDTVDPASAPAVLDAVRTSGKLDLLGRHAVVFDLDDDVVMHRRKRLPFHTNAMTFEALDADGARVVLRTYYSIGGGFVLDETEAADAAAEG